MNEGNQSTKEEALLQLITILNRHCGERGDNEGAVETLERIIKEREILIRNGIKEKLLKLY